MISVKIDDLDFLAILTKFWICAGLKLSAWFKFCKLQYVSSLTINAI